MLAAKNRQTTWSRLILISIIVYLVTISLMKTKLPWYLVPVYPFLALAVGAKLSEIWQKENFQAPIWAGFLAIIAIASLGGCVYFSIGDFQPILIVMSVVLAMTMGIAAWKIQKCNRQFIPVLFTGMYLVLGMLMISPSWIWELNEAFAVKPVAALIKSHIPAKTKIYTSFRYHRPSLDFYCDCQVISANIPVLEKMWADKSYLLLDKGTLEKINLPNSKILGTVENFTLISP